MAFPEDVSDIPLTEDIAGRKQNFIFSYYEWLSARAQRIMKSGGVTAAVDFIYTVPEGRVLFIVSSYLSINITSGPGVPTNAGSLRFHETSENILTITSDHVADGSSTATGSYIIPIRADAGVRISLTAGSGMRTNGGFIGFLVSKTDLTFS